jgi:hypothetical protein
MAPNPHLRVVVLKSKPTGIYRKEGFMEIREDACESFCRMERAISESRPFRGPLDFQQLKEAGEEWNRLYVSADGIEKWGDVRF